MKVAQNQKYKHLERVLRQEVQSQYLVGNPFNFKTAETRLGKDSKSFLIFSSVIA